MREQNSSTYTSSQLLCKYKRCTGCTYLQIKKKERLKWISWKVRENKKEEKLGYDKDKQIRRLLKKKVISLTRKNNEDMKRKNNTWISVIRVHNNTYS